MNTTNQIPVIIHVESTQTYEDMGSDKITQTYFGTLQLTEGGYHLTYEEKSADMNVTTTLTMKNTKLIMTRSGECQMEMVFSQGTTEHSPYTTPYGELNMVVHTTSLKSNISSQGGTIHLEYTLSLSHSTPGNVIFKLSIERDIS